jgi:ABC-type branched-subunit amino acid transport system ATPase component
VRKEGKSCVLCVRGMSVRRGKREVVKDVSFHVAGGEIVALLGANGSGKTSVLLAVAGEIGVDRGSVRVSGLLTTHEKSWVRCRGDVAVVPQVDYLYEGLSIDDNLKVAAAFTNGRDREARIRQAQAMWGRYFPQLDGGQKVQRLSAGEARLLSVICGIMREKRVVLLDEPSAGLSQGLAEMTFKMLRSTLTREAGILVAEQRQELALSISDRVTVLNDGCVVWSGIVSEYRAAVGAAVNS